MPKKSKPNKIINDEGCTKLPSFRKPPMPDIEKELRKKAEKILEDTKRTFGFGM